jgi:hypothetical protein
MFASEKSAARMVLAVAMALGGCTATELVQDGSPPPVADLSQPNYQRIVAANIKKMFPNPPDADLEISGLRPVDHIKGPAWLTCLRVDPGGNPQQYAIFIQNDAVIDWRAAVVIDQCHKQPYSPLETLPEPEKVPPPARKVASPRSSKRL